MKRILSFIFVFSIFFPDLYSAAYYVSTTGLDSHTGSQDSPWQTIQHAVDSVNNGDTILVNNGTYEEHVVISDILATEGSSITLRAIGTNVLIDVTDVGSGSGINIDNSTYIVVDGFRVTGGTWCGIYPSLSDHVTIKNCVCYNNEDIGIFTAFCDYIVIENNKCYNNQGSHGIYFSNSGDYPVIRGNISYNNQGSGIHMNADINIQPGDGIISHALVENNIIYGNNDGHGGAAISMDGVQDSIIRNNLIYNNYDQGLAFFQIDGGDGSKRNKILNNTIYFPAGQGSRAMGIEDNSSDCTVMNNIIISGNSGGSAVDVYNSSLIGLVMDNNIIYNNGSGGLVSNNDGGSYNTLSAWQAANGKDANSKNVAPASIFVSVGTGTFHISSNSQAKDAGATLSDVTVDLDGKTRPLGSAYDIGCYEYGNSLEYYSISGYVKDSMNSAIRGATVSLTGKENSTTFTDTSGFYSFTDLSTGAYIVTPSLANWSFAPLDYSYNLLMADRDNQDFTGTYTGTTYKISGAVKDVSGTGAAGILVALSGGLSRTATTDANGTYEFGSLPPGNYTIMPGKANWEFVPLSRTATLSTAGLTGQDFAGADNGKAVFSVRNNLVNPLKGEKVKLAFNVQSAGYAALEIYNMDGTLIKSVIERSYIDKGPHSIDWDGTDKNGTIAPSGIYIARLKQGSTVTTKKICVVK